MQFRITEGIKSITPFLVFVFSLVSLISCQNESSSVAKEKPSIVKTQLTSMDQKADVETANISLPEKDVKLEEKVEKKQVMAKPVVKPIEEAKPIKKKPVKKKVVKEQAPKKKKPVIQSAPEELPQAKISFDRMNHSFGEIKSGDKYDHKFYFTNTGSTELIINKVTATCGCTQPSYPFIPIAPGEKGFIGVHYNSVGKDGPQRPKVTVYTNAEPANYSLYLEGDVLAKEEIAPEETAE